MRLKKRLELIKKKQELEMWALQDPSREPTPDDLKIIDTHKEIIEVIEKKIEKEEKKDEEFINQHRSRIMQNKNHE